MACIGSGARAAWFGLGVAAVVTAVASAAPCSPSCGRTRAAPPSWGSVSSWLRPAAGADAGGRTPRGRHRLGRAGGRGRVDEWQVGRDVLAGPPAVRRGPRGLPRGVPRRGRRALRGRARSRGPARPGPRRPARPRAWRAVCRSCSRGAVLAWFTARSAWSALRSGPGWLRGVAAGARRARGRASCSSSRSWSSSRSSGSSPGCCSRRAPRRGAAPAPLDPAVPTGPAPGPRGARARRARGAGSGVTEIVADHRADDAVEALGRGDRRSAADAADAAADLRPDVVRLHLLAARTAVADDQGFQTALAHVDDALDVSPRGSRSRCWPGPPTSCSGPRPPAPGPTSWMPCTRSSAASARIRYHPACWRLGARVAELAGDRDGADRPGAERRAADPTREDEDE